MLPNDYNGSITMLRNDYNGFITLQLSLQPVKGSIDANAIAYQSYHRCTCPPKLSSKQSPAKAIIDADAITR